MPKRLTPMYPFGFNVHNNALKSIAHRIGKTDLPHYHKDTVPGANGMAIQLATRGGFPQQERMIRDKRKSLDRATLYSYQAALIKKCIPEEMLMEGEDNLPARALINPDKNKFDYDNKIVSVGFEYDFHPGDVFEWLRTNSYWLITLQDLDEIAYFRGEIRRCDYILSWKDEDGNIQSSYVSVRGPVETKINFIQKHGISIDEPNHSLHIYMPRTEAACKYFKRYAKFYLSSADAPVDQICWRVEAVDAVSTVGILELNAVEYYANKDTDDLDNGIVNAFIQKVEPEENEGTKIIGETFIKPKVFNDFYINILVTGTWTADSKTLGVIKLEPYVNEQGYQAVHVKWNTSYSGQFDLCFTDSRSQHKYTKTIVVESLF